MLGSLLLVTEASVARIRYSAATTRCAINDVCVKSQRLLLLETALLIITLLEKPP